MLKEREEYYIRLIKESESLIEVCRKANIVPTTGNYDTLKKVINNNNVDISHFKRISGGNTEEKDISEYLVKNSNISSYRLKNKILRSGIKEHRCEKCENTEWYGEPIPLELHHINGDNTDNRLENLQILCPNCHSFTDNYGGKNQKINKKIENKQYKDNRLISDEEIDLIIKLSNNYSSIIDLAKKTKHGEKTIKKILEKNSIILNKNKSKKEENDKKIPYIIESLKKTKSYRKTGLEFGVSDNAIRKMLARRGYPSHIKELLDIIN